MSLSLTADDIDTVESAGILDGKEVKMCRTKGGWWFAVDKGKVISAGSHPAIVRHTISKMYPNFQPVMCKSEAFSDAIVEQHSHFLSDDLRKSGHDIYSIQTGMNIEFQITKNNLKVASVSGSIQDDSLYIDELAFPKQFTKSLASAATEKALDSKLKTIKVR
jgi:hypothetical protein